MKDVYQKPISRWLLFLWIGIAYFAEIWWGNVFLNHIRLDLLALFTIFIALHLSLYWISLSPRLHRFWQIGYFAGQGVIVLLISLLSRSLSNATLIIILYLMLIGEAMMVFRRSYYAIAVAAGYLLLFGISTTVHIPSTWLPVESRFSWLLIWIPLFIVVPLIPFLVGYVQAQAREQDQRLLRELKIAHTQLAAYAIRVEELTLITERQRLARELHDTLAQGLAGLILQLEVANARLKQSQTRRAQEIVQHTIVLARTALTDARSAIDHLRLDVVSPDDLPRMVQEKVEHFTTVTGIPCDLDLAALSTTPVSQCEHVLRIISEALENVSRHAQAHHVCIRALTEKSMLCVEIRDDGCGFDPVAVASQIGHYGLLGLRERARLMGGQLKIESTWGKGTLLRLSFSTSLQRQRDASAQIQGEAAESPYEISDEDVPLAWSLSSRVVEARTGRKKGKDE